MKKGVDFIGITVSYICHDEAGNILLAKRGVNCRDEHGRWDNGGGSIEFGHTAEETLKKEIAEEYGVEPIEYEFMGFRDVFREHEGQKTHWVSLDYRVLVDRAKVRNNEPHKFDDIGWFTLDALPEPMHSQSSTIMSKFRHAIAARVHR